MCLPQFGPVWICQLYGSLRRRWAWELPRTGPRGPTGCPRITTGLDRRHRGWNPRDHDLFNRKEEKYLIVKQPHFKIVKPLYFSAVKPLNFWNVKQLNFSVVKQRKIWNVRFKQLHNNFSQLAKKTLMKVLIYNIDQYLCIKHLS